MNQETQLLPTFYTLTTDHGYIQEVSNNVIYVVKNADVSKDVTITIMGEIWAPDGYYKDVH
ncbi:MAG: hypothetical protein ACW99Q_14915, partial [Candidatus Kariarchaeaceae archaeon]